MKRILLILLSSALISSCGGGSDSSQPTPEIPPPPPTQLPGLLVQIETEDDLVDSVKRGFKYALALGVVRVPAEYYESRFTTTYTLESNVDEHDYVKYDGEHLYIAPSRGLDCCFVLNSRIADYGLADFSADQEKSIRIMSTDPSTAGITQVGSIPLEDGNTIEGLYLNNNSLALINSSGWWGRWGTSFETLDSWVKQSVGFKIYNSTNTQSPEKLWEMEVEGGFVSSRRVGNKVHLVVRHTPEIEGLEYFVGNATTAINNDELIDALTFEDILPKFKINGVEGDILQADSCYVTDINHELAPANTGSPTLTVILAIDIEDPAIVSAVCYDEPTNGIYVSENSIYLTQGEHTDDDERKTLIHKFLIGSSIIYGGSGKVKGYINGGSNRDFRINEHEGYLRLVTSSQIRYIVATNTYPFSAVRTVFDHNLFILKKSLGQLNLETIASLPNSSLPQSIGKPDEDLYGVRFLGNQLYLVTYETIDPLYVLDLSDHYNPVIAGELEVKGFSDFIHPVNENLLLGLGGDENGLVKLELFNIENINDPFSLDSVLLGEGADWNYSEARYNRKAFTYLNNNTGPDRFTVPVSSSFYNQETGYTTEKNLYLFEILDKNLPASASINPVGTISSPDNPADGYWAENIFRSILHNDAVYFILNGYVWSALWTTPQNQSGPH